MAWAARWKTTSGWTSIINCFNFSKSLISPVLWMISFLISIPTIFGANILNLSDTKIDYFKDDYYLLIVAFLVSFIVSFYTIKYFLNFLQKFSLNIFVIIRIFLDS